MADTKSEAVRSGHCALRLEPCGFTIDLDEMARRPLPGGIAAAAAGAAMGAALIAKSVRVALRRQAPEAEDRLELEEIAERADRHAAGMLDLAGADTDAYRSVIDTRAREAGDPARQRAWLAAAEVPLRLAELSVPLEAPVQALFDRCPSLVHIDLRIGARLLYAASEAGRLAAEESLERCADSHEAGALRLRLAALKETPIASEGHWGMPAQEGDRVGISPRNMGVVV